MLAEKEDQIDESEREKTCIPLVPDQYKKP